MTHEMVILIVPIVQTEKQTTFSPLPLGQEAEFKSEQFNPTAYLPINRALIESQRERELVSKTMDSSSWPFVWLPRVLRLVCCTP